MSFQTAIYITKFENLVTLNSQMVVFWKVSSEMWSKASCFNLKNIQNITTAEFYSFINAIQKRLFLLKFTNVEISYNIFNFLVELLLNWRVLDQSIIRQILWYVVHVVNVVKPYKFINPIWNSFACEIGHDAKVLVIKVSYSSSYKNEGYLKVTFLNLLCKSLL